MPLDQLETKLVSSTTVLDLTLCKNEMVHLLSSKNSAKVDELPDTKALLDKYFEGMHNVMELMNISKQNRYCGEAVLADLEKQIQCLTEVCLLRVHTHGVHVLVLACLHLSVLYHFLHFCRNQ